MRRLIDQDRIYLLMAELGRAARSDSRVYLTGGATAVLLEWRASTIDVDLEIRPEADEVLRAIPAIKESLQINVELASPGHFIPELPAWEDRSLFIARHGRLSFYHYDFYAQVLSKIERGHARDLIDIKEMFRRRLVDGARLLAFFVAIEPLMYRYPAIDPKRFRLAVDDVIATLG